MAAILAKLSLLIILCLASSLCLAQTEPSAPPSKPTCAIAVDLTEHESLLPLVSLLEIELAKQQTVTLLDRVDVQKVLREQELNLMFAPEGGPSRVATGKIIRANLLVLLRPAKTIDKTSALQIVISESRRGQAQLEASESQPLTPTATATHLIEQIADMFGRVIGRQPARNDPDADAKQLAERAALYERLGQYQEALALVNASLLVIPNELKLHYTAVKLSTRFADGPGNHALVG